jgi:hypothetical protein
MCSNNCSCSQMQDGSGVQAMMHRPTSSCICMSLYRSQVSGLHVQVCIDRSVCTGVHVQVCMYRCACTGLRSACCTAVQHADLSGHASIITFSQCRSQVSDPAVHAAIRQPLAQDLVALQIHMSQSTTMQHCHSLRQKQ